MQRTPAQGRVGRTAARHDAEASRAKARKVFVAALRFAVRAPRKPWVIVLANPSNACVRPTDGFTAVRKTKCDPPWTKIGAAIPHKEGIGFSIELKAFPLDGRLVALPPDTDEGNGRNGK